MRWAWALLDAFTIGAESINEQTDLMKRICRSRVSIENSHICARGLLPLRDELDCASMDPFRELGRTLLVLGAFLVLVGAFFYFGGKLPFRLGRLPGDIVHKGEHTTFYFPIVTCLVLSVGLSLLFWLLSRFRR